MKKESNIMPLLNFKNNENLTVGVELELQLVSRHSFKLIMEADDFLRRLQDSEFKENIKPEITKSMIEINSSIHNNPINLQQELFQLRNCLSNTAKEMHIGICGGGTHPFQKWKEQKIFQTDRFLSISQQYGYLAKQFTVFGQHIHISCKNGNDALYLCHALAYYIPHFIALAASSPYNQTVDTSFDCSRLSVISAFPLSGTPPWIFEWDEFKEYFNGLYELEVIKSMKDFYWDIRPKPEYGTVEIRICDTPLTMQKACDLAFYAYNLSGWLMEEKQKISHNIYLTYLINRFRAARFGLNAQIINPINKVNINLADEIINTCQNIKDHAKKTNSFECIERIKHSVEIRENDAQWLRNKFVKFKSLEDVVRAQTEIWMR